MAMERKDKLLEGRIAKYKEGIPVSYNLDQIPGLAETKTPEAAPAGPAAQPAASAPAAPNAAPAASNPAAASASVAKAAPAASPAAPSDIRTRPAAQPAAQGLSSKSSPVQTVPGQAAVDPRLPREPGQEPVPAMAKPKPLARKRVYKRPSDTTDTRATAPKPAAETTPETPGPKPDAEENPNAQTPAETP
jgi:hypothetical protein